MTLDEIVKKAIAEDTGDGDHTSLATVPPNARGKAKLVAKEDGVLAGTEIAKKVFKTIDPETSFRLLIEEGSEIRKGDIVFEVEGRSRSILTAERLALNFLQRMSGIATFTRMMVSEISGTGARILDTRKTTPLMREIEKMAVRIGGGYNHRMGLYDMIMIKDNHVDFAGGIGKAIEAVNQYLEKKGKDLKIEIEVRNFDELEQVLEAGGIDRIMLDNFTPGDLQKALQMIDKRYETEASGGINLENIREYARTGVDYISVGALTHHIKSLDLSLKAD